MPIKYDLTKDIRFKEGFEKGEYKKARTSAIRMLNEGVPIKSIAEFLDVSMDFVLKIQEELERNPNLK